MKVTLSDREMVGLWDFMRGSIWGNTDETMLAQLELWDTLEFETRFAWIGPTADMAKISDEQHEFELGDQAITLLRSYLSHPGQGFRTGVAAARALKRMLP